MAILRKKSLKDGKSFELSVSPNMPERNTFFEFDKLRGRSSCEIAIITIFISLASTVGDQSYLG